MKRVLIAIVVLALLIGGFFWWRALSGARQQAQQEAAVRATVNNYLGASKKLDIKSMLALLTESLRSRSPSPEKAADILKEGQKKAGKVVSWKIEKLEITGPEEATVEVSVKSERASYSGTFYLRTENGKWQVDDIRSKKM